MNDVALAAGVSVSTVSHVINGTRPVDQATATLVRSAIESVGYIPNTLARSLARSATSTIGVAISTFANHYFTDIVRSIDSACQRAGLMMLFSDTHDDPVQELRVVQAFHQRRVDGILLAPTDDGSMQALAYLRAKDVPAVLVDHVHPGAPFDQVGTDNTHAMQALVEHLIGHGHRRIGFVSGAVSNSTSGERLAGYQGALQQAGLSFDKRLVACGESSVEPARQATHRLLTAAARPTAIVSGNNLMTVGALHAFRDAGISVPEDIAFAAFDDLDWADLVSPRLTVVAQPLEAIGTEAASRLILRMANRERRRKLVRLPATLRIRTSCGCHPADGVAGSPAGPRRLVEAT